MPDQHGDTSPSRTDRDRLLGAPWRRPPSASQRVRRRARPAVASRAASSPTGSRRPTRSSWCTVAAVLGRQCATATYPSAGSASGTHSTRSAKDRSLMSCQSSTSRCSHSSPAAVSPACSRTRSLSVGTNRPRPGADAPQVPEPERITPRSSRITTAATPGPRARAGRTSSMVCCARASCAALALSQAAIRSDRLPLRRRVERPTG